MLSYLACACVAFSWSSGTDHKRTTPIESQDSVAVIKGYLVELETYFKDKLMNYVLPVIDNVECSITDHVVEEGLKNKLLRVVLNLKQKVSYNISYFDLISDRAGYLLEAIDEIDDVYPLDPSLKHYIGILISEVRSNADARDFYLMELNVTKLLGAIKNIDSTESLHYDCDNAVSLMQDILGRIGQSQ